jgi:hypothetical protein
MPATPGLAFLGSDRLAILWASNRAEVMASKSSTTALPFRTINRTRKSVKMHLTFGNYAPSTL